MTNPIYTPAFREHAVRMVREHQAEYPSQQAAINEIAERLSCSKTSLRAWIRLAEDDARRAGLTAYERRRLKDLERENRELRNSNELLRRASTFWAKAAFERAPVEAAFLPRRPARNAPTE